MSGLEGDLGDPVREMLKPRAGCAPFQGEL